MQTKWKSVWITGASSGIGAALAQKLDGEAQVAISARSEDALSRLAKNGRTLLSYPLDVTDQKATAKTIAVIEAEAGPIDLAVLNAGAWQLMDATDLDLDAIRRGVEVNILGVMNALHLLIPLMVARGRGHIAIVASVAGYRGLPRSIAYGPTKAALINLAETLNAELADKGIVISVVNPGFVDTPMTRDNPFPMPGLISVDMAATALLRGLQRERFEIAFPYLFTRVMKFLRILPNSVYFFILKHFVKI